MARDDPHQEDATVHRVEIGGKGHRVAIFVMDNQTGGPLGRIAKVAKQLVEDGADVSVLVSNRSHGEDYFASNIHVIPYDPQQIRWPGKLNPKRLVAKLKPDTLLMDEYPFVAQEYASEWERIIKAAKSANKSCKVVSLALDKPVYYMDQEAANLPARVKGVDSILATSDPSISRVQDRIREDVVGCIEPKLSYVGYLDHDRGMKSATVPSPTSNDILVYLGGVNLSQLASRYIAILANIPLLDDSMRHQHWRFVMPALKNMTGGQKIETFINTLPEDVRERISLEETGTDFDEKIQKASMVVCGGGNTCVESVLVHGKPTVILPGFVGDQYLRANDFSNRFSWVGAANLSVPTIRTHGYRHSHFFPTNHRLHKKFVVYDQWPQKVHDWVQDDDASATLRSTIESVFAQRDSAHDKPVVMLDGAKRISDYVRGVTGDDALAR